MLVHVPDHFSSSLEFNLNKKIAKVTDRTSFLKSLSGLIFGISLSGLGCFELFSFIHAEKQTGMSFLSVEIFAFAVLIIGLLLIFGAVFSLNRYKRIFFDGSKFTIIYAPSFGVKHCLTEELHNYTGVRLRVLFTQTGIFHRNRYIIDLLHNDSDKIIPLYITTRNKNIRKIWEGYAKALKMPALSVGDRGVIEREYTDLDKSLKELHALGKLPYIASGKFPCPSTLFIEDKKDRTIVRPSGVYWDIFSSLFLFIALSAVFILIIGGLYLTILGNIIPLKHWMVGFLLLFISIYYLCRLFSSYQLEISSKYVSVKETLFGTTLKEEKIADDEIENIELSYNPIIDRYSLAVISDDKVISFGGRLPVNDLLWLKDFVVRKLIGN